MVQRLRQLGARPQVLIARSKIAVSALAVSSLPIPPKSQILPPSSVAAAYCCGVGVSLIACHSRSAVVGVAPARPERSSTDASWVDPMCPAVVAPPMA